jgi:adenosylcobinamide-GDP ribazoletransferase
MSGLWRALGLLTRFPVPRCAGGDRGLRGVLGWIPVVGAILSALLLLLAWLVQHATPLSPLASALLQTLALTVVTGGLHLDAVADTADGLSAGHGNPSRTLEVMRDSHVGAHGAVAVALVLLGKLVLLAELLGRGHLLVAAAGPLVARSVVVPVIWLFPSARRDGLGAALKGQSGRRGAVVALATLAATVALLPGATIPTAAAAMCAGALAGWICHRVGGLTGDAYGAIIESCELAWWLAAASSGGAA